MLLELHVAGLGVIEDSRISFRNGLTALTGETGAGKTLLVDALNLVLGGKPQRGLVPPDRTAFVEAVFLDDTGTELILAREIPTDGRSRAWIDGRMASASALEERARGLCDIYGQHEHQSLLRGGAVRHALDIFGDIDTTELVASRRELRELLNEQRLLGGDQEMINREIDLLRHQISEIEAADIKGPSEIDELLNEIKLLENASHLRFALERGLSALDGEEVRPRDALAELAQTLQSHTSLQDVHESLIHAQLVLEELASLLRRTAEVVEEDPVRLSELNERLSLLHDLCRRFGPSLLDVENRLRSFRESLATLVESQDRRASLTQRLQAATARVAEAEERTGEARRKAAVVMTTDLQNRLASLALERAVVVLELNGPGGDDVQLLFSANPGLSPQPVGKVASGGELARLMLALRLVLPDGPRTMIFDEVDAGIGGATAITLASALRDVAQDRQVLVVTHLAQVAAAADHHVVVTKAAEELFTKATAHEIDGPERISEIARMLSGHPDSPTARSHAAELLEK